MDLTGTGAEILWDIGFALLLCTIYSGVIRHRMCQHRTCGLIALGDALMLPRVMGDRDVFTTGLHTAALAYMAWLWWRGGGGDNTKRRLRQLGRKFAGVRRTASQAA